MILCTNCRRPYPEEGTPYRCPVCGGLFDEITPLEYQPGSIDPSLPGIWRYRQTFGLGENAPVVSLGEGNTPLVEGEAHGQQVFFKCEYLNPSGSFKDRGSATLVSFLRSRGVLAAVEDSSGNAGASFAAYAARAGMQGKVYVPDLASGPKRNQIGAYGAEVVEIPGPRSNAADAVRQVAAEGITYASHAYLPFNLPGYATLAYELAAQLAEQKAPPPATVILPAGQGGLLLGAWRGFQALKNAGMLPELPRMVGVQARACAPLWALSSYGPAGLAWVSEGATLAEGVRVLHPLRGDAVVQAVESSGGMFLSVEEVDILPGRDQLARRGFYVEPTSALVWNAFGQLVDQVSGDIPQPVVIVLTGHGLKSP